MTSDGLTSALRATRVMVIGDVMLDKYIYGGVTRISPEAPVPVVEVSNEEARLGGALNVLMNLRSLGVTTSICGIIGNDQDASLLRHILANEGIRSEGLVSINARRTTVKNRIIAQAQHMLRLDYEDSFYLNEVEEHFFLNAFYECFDSFRPQSIIFQDYNKGLLTSSIIRIITKLCKDTGTLIFVDPKKKNFWEYSNATLFKPNLVELSGAFDSVIPKSNLDIVRRYSLELLAKTNSEYALVTLSDQGMLLCGNGVDVHLPAHRRNIVDVSGAGDTVISVVAACFCAGLPISMAVALANIAGGLVCEDVGVVPIDYSKLTAEAISKNILT